MAGMEHEHTGGQYVINERSNSITHYVKSLSGGISMRFGPVEKDNVVVGLLQETHTNALAYLFPRSSLCHADEALSSRERVYQLLNSSSVDVSCSKNNYVIICLEI
jgi:cation transport regulator ChaC